MLVFAERTNYVVAIRQGKTSKMVAYETEQEAVDRFSEWGAMITGGYNDSLAYYLEEYFDKGITVIDTMDITVSLYDRGALS
ncbi:MAG: hypothetical protein LIO65_00150 [Odoribacter sp.]|nr:hypothetical protein [Odoribacter sp.]